MLVRKLAAGRQVDKLCGSFMAGLAGALGEVQRTAESRGQGHWPSVHGHRSRSGDRGGGQQHGAQGPPQPCLLLSVPDPR